MLPCNWRSSVTHGISQFCECYIIQWRSMLNDPCCTTRSVSIHYRTSTPCGIAPLSFFSLQPTFSRKGSSEDYSYYLFLPEELMNLLQTQVTWNHNKSSSHSSNWKRTLKLLPLFLRLLENFYLHPVEDHCFVLSLPSVCLWTNTSSLLLTVGLCPFC